MRDNVDDSGNGAGDQTAQRGDKDVYLRGACGAVGRAGGYVYIKPRRLVFADNARGDNRCGDNRHQHYFVQFQKPVKRTDHFGGALERGDNLRVDRVRAVFRGDNRIRAVYAGDSVFAEVREENETEIRVHRSAYRTEKSRRVAGVYGRVKAVGVKDKRHRDKPRVRQFGTGGVFYEYADSESRP